MCLQAASLAAMAGNGSRPASASARSRATPVVVSSETPRNAANRVGVIAGHADGQLGAVVDHVLRARWRRPRPGPVPRPPSSSDGWSAPRRPARPAPRRRRRGSSTGSIRPPRPGRRHRPAPWPGTRSWPRGGRRRPPARPAAGRPAADGRSRRAPANGAGPSRSAGAPTAPTTRPRSASVAVTAGPLR